MIVTRGSGRDRVEGSGDPPYSCRVGRGLRKSLVGRRKLRPCHRDAKRGAESVERPKSHQHQQFACPTLHVPRPNRPRPPSSRVFRRRAGARCRPRRPRSARARNRPGRAAVAVEVGHAQPRVGVRHIVQLHGGTAVAHAGRRPPSRSRTHAPGCLSRCAEDQVGHPVAVEVGHGGPVADDVDARRRRTSRSAPWGTAPAGLRVFR